jgi:hypothetical protein
MNKLTAEHVGTLLSYDPETGVLTWRVRRGGTASAGSVAGCRNKDGYLVFSLCNRIQYAHRVAWLLTHGAWPDGDIDHRDGNRSNNALANLRDVTRRVNLENRRRAAPNTTTGLIGAGKGKPNGGYRSRICVNGKERHLGTFATPEQAHEAYVAAKRQLHEGNTL